jgi:DNA polymerase-1
MQPKGKGPLRIDVAMVKQRYNISPSLVTDFIALRGDPSDNLPGAKGIGPKTAADLLNRHGSLEATIDNANRESQRIWAILKTQAEQLAIFKQIATLQTVPVQRPASRLTDREGGARAATKLGMAQLGRRVG